MTQDEEEYVREIEDALIAAEEHLDYCGYGDPWERECADQAGLSDKIGAAVSKIEARRKGEEYAKTES